MKKYIIIGMFYSMMCVVTYGHAYKQFSAENAICEARKEKTDKYIYCGTDLLRLNAFIASIFWPQHWSEALWK